MAKNANLHAARTAKNDEFYTQLSDIVNELKHYEHHFKDKVVYCNCETFTKGRRSNFWNYFTKNFERLGLKKLIATSYNENGKGLLYIYNGDTNKNESVDEEEIEKIEMEGNGDFRSEECVELLKQADIVVTNPPFSLFREYVAQLMEYGKRFLIIGSMNAITYKEIFPLIKKNEIWSGYKSFSGGMNFNVDEENYDASKEKQKSKIINGKIVKNIMGCIWFTNLDHKKRHEPLYLHKRYSNEYPKYDNYDAIEVSKVAEIPMDYEGVMGVPISFLDKYCPEQFEIVGLANSARYIGNFPCLTIINGKKIYNRLLIKRINILA